MKGTYVMTGTERILIRYLERQLMNQIESIKELGRTVEPDADCPLNDHWELTSRVFGAGYHTTNCPICGEEFSY